MNAERRKILKSIRLQIEAAHRALSDFNFIDLNDEIQNVLNDEQEAFDNMPESLQEGDRGQKAQVAIDQLEGAISDMSELDEVLQKLENIASCLETAAE